MSTPITDQDWVEIVRRKVGNLRFGVVQIVVHDHRVTQIEVTEKTRLDGSSRREAGERAS